ncbi:MAG: SDR family oxidoreductase [Balneolaceae bacterium]|nr:MAG: SDR family oxidoreductase [Balneolaceae bacterium]
MKRLDQKRCIVTGGSAGIGKAIVQRFLNEGARVMVGDLNPPDFDGTEYVMTDVGDPDSVRQLVEKATALFGGLDVMVNNAGIGMAGTVTDTEPDDFDRMVRVNLKGVFLGLKYAVQAMQKQQSGGSVINMSSIGGLAGLYERAAYCATKGGVTALTKAAAIDHAKEGIRINAIAPGTVNTPWVQHITSQMADPEAKREAMKQRQAHGRMVEPEEVAAMAVYLASDESRSTIGAIMLVDGGFMAR